MATNESEEIEKIMSEIEELQKEMTPSSGAAVTTSSTAATGAASSSSVSMSGVEEDILREIQESAQSDHGRGEYAAGLEETLGELKQEEAAGGILADATPQDTDGEQGEETMSHSNSNGDGTLSLTLTGNMALKLRYEYEGQEITISFVDQSLRVQMTDGTEFKVPVTRTQAISNVKPFKKAV